MLSDRTMSVPPEFHAGDALLVVDPQNDFCPGGSLAVAQGDQIMPILSRWAAAAAEAGSSVFVSRDWHPPKTTHFKEYGGIWPPHCLMGTHGAEVHATLNLPGDITIVSKGMGEAEDAYSAFQARDEHGTLLAELLKRDGVQHLYIGGLATDYCVRSSALDALSSGFGVTLIADAMRAVNLQPTDGQQALQEMHRAGAIDCETS